MKYKALEKKQKQKKKPGGGTASDLKCIKHVAVVHYAFVFFLSCERDIVLKEVERKNKREKQATRKESKKKTQIRPAQWNRPRQNTEDLF